MIDLNDVHSPCMQCYIHGVEYSPESDHCQRCEFNIAVQFAKKVAKYQCGCALCKHRLICVIPVTSCVPEDDFHIDWKEAFDKYGLEYDS